jgi:hypothetical protein
MMTLAASEKSARERIWVFWMLANELGERNSPAFCAAAVQPPKAASNAQPVTTNEILLARIERLPLLNLFP